MSTKTSRNAPFGRVESRLGWRRAVRAFGVAIRDRRAAHTAIASVLEVSAIRSINVTLVPGMVRKKLRDTACATV